MLRHQTLRQLFHVRCLFLTMVLVTARDRDAMFQQGMQLILDRIGTQLRQLG